MDEKQRQIRRLLAQYRDSLTGELIAMKEDYGPHTPQRAALEQLLYERNRVEVRAASRRAWIAISLSVVALIVTLMRDFLFPNQPITAPVVVQPQFSPNVSLSSRATANSPFAFR